MDNLYSDLVKLSADRHRALREMRELHQFTRECDDVEAWVCEKELVAANEDLGKDVEHVEVCGCRCDGVRCVGECESQCCSVN